MKKRVKVVDLFCGIGGMTHGFEQEGFNVVAGIDIDGTCKYGYEKNNGAIFIQKNIGDVETKEIKHLFDGADLKVLIGCAPCQPYSKLNIKKKVRQNVMPLERYAEIIDELKPEIVSMENVRGLASDKKVQPAFAQFLKTLEKNGYKYSYKVVNASEYGVPQSRFRLVLLASRFGEIQLIEATNKDKKVTVRDVISDLPPLTDGQVDRHDPFHRARRLSEINKRRIKMTPKNGGTSKSWSEDLILECHKKESGKSFRSVYGRMKWDEPSPTMTTQCTGLGNGRFGHPEQDRAISLREAARFQTFPDSYVFSDPKEAVRVGEVAKFIGNAVPVKLGSIIAKSIKIHLEKYNNDNVSLSNVHKSRSFARLGNQALQ